MTKIEEVARALYINSGLTYSNDNYWNDLAKVAIKAMREPTKKMLKAAENEQSPSYEYNENGMSIDIWRAMIDAALKE